MKFCLSSSLLNTKLKSSAPGGNPGLHGVKAAINHLRYATAVYSHTRRMGYKLFSKQRNKVSVKVDVISYTFPFCLQMTDKFFVSKKSEI
jgi:hypothetical protein